MRRSPKARLRRNLGRLRRYQEVAAQTGPERDGEVELILPRAPRMGNLCVNLEQIVVTLGGKKIFGPLDLEIAPGRKIGVVGANGTGKTTLLRVIAGTLSPDAGVVKIAPTVEFNYIDQNKLLLNQENTVYDEIAEGVDQIAMGGDKISVRAYLRRFLFEDDRINTQIKYLSGGEKARLTLAKILKRGGNFLILDEPTNDLDLTTLRLLEEALAAYDGTVLVVSHDRYFLNRICDGIIGFDGAGECFYTPGDYDYYIAKRAECCAPAVAAVRPVSVPRAEAAPPPEERSRKLSFREQRELTELERRIPEIEERIAALEAIFQSPDFFTRHGTQSRELNAELEQCKTELETVMTRWLELAEYQ
ncbi:Vitamin B12 import ATP-binding protein BtuD [bioreactor metagenome]|uniref:Vitamin B12 import ATP-binding protein BtuD n=1 Tax=bioreactor metagenome TaxID=1076179 RepID=A0A645CLS1_9ZZZZ